MDTLNLICSLIILIVAIPGILFSSLIVYLYVSGFAEKTSFNVICLVRAVNNIIVLVVNFLIFLFPTLLLSYNYMSSTLDQTLTITTIDIYVYNEFQSLLIAINRFIAMYAPLHYNKLCSVKVSVVIMALYYVKKIYGSLKSSYSVYEAGCQQYLDLATFKRQYENASCESTSTNNVDDFGFFIFLFSVGYLVLLYVINLLTFYQILKFYLRKNNQRSNEDSASIRKNIRLFFQTVLQDSVFAIDQLFTFGLNSLSDHRIWLFVSTMLVWEMVHLLDGLIMLLFSNRLSTLKAIMVSKKLISIGGGKPSEARSGNQVHSLGEVG